MDMIAQTILTPNADASFQPCLVNSIPVTVTTTLNAKSGLDTCTTPLKDVESNIHLYGNDISQSISSLAQFGSFTIVEAKVIKEAIINIYANYMNFVTHSIVLNCSAWFTAYLYI